MYRRKEKKKIFHETTTHEMFGCLASMPSYSKLLLESGPKRAYAGFLRWLLEINFNRDKNEKTVIKKLAADFKTDSAKVTKWIKEIYDDIFQLNDEKPELFSKVGVKVVLYFKHYDSSCAFQLSLPVLPRQFETVNFYFVKGKVGVDYFWVSKVEHSIGEDWMEVTIWLKGGFLNRYREFAMDKALFQGKIGFLDVFDKHDFELDDEIKKVYRD